MRIDTAQPRHSAVLAAKVLQPWDRLLFGVLTVLSLAAIAYFLSYWLSSRDWLDHPVVFSLLTLIVLIKLSINQFRWFLLPQMKKPRPKPWKPGWKVGVATTFVSGVEPLAMLEKTVRALVGLDYLHDTWVLDEEDDERVRALCLSVGARHFSRRNLPQYHQASGIFQSESKHGNYNAWLSEIGFERYDIISVFDPDHVPEADFITNVLGYFEDSQVGYVQAAQAYYNQSVSFVARAAAEETYAYYSVTQMASYGMGYPVVVGCHNTHRVSALRDVGGFAPHAAEDLLITLLYRARGWHGVYVPRILARGLTPVDWNGYLTQQLRWARSVLDIKFHFYPKLASRLSLRERVFSALHGLSYVEGGITIPLGLALLLSMLVTGIEPAVVSQGTLARFAVLYAVLQVCDLYRQRFYLDWRRERGLHWRPVLLQLAKWPYFVRAMVDVLRGRPVPYAVTGKTEARPRHDMLVWPQLAVVGVILTAWGAGVAVENVQHSLLHVAAAGIVLGSTVLMWTAVPEISRGRPHGRRPLTPEGSKPEFRPPRP